MASNALTRLPRLELIDITRLPRDCCVEQAKLDCERRVIRANLVTEVVLATLFSLPATLAALLSILMWATGYAVAGAALAVLSGISLLFFIRCAGAAHTEWQKLKETAIPARLVHDAETERLLEAGALEINRRAMSWNAVVLRAYIDEVNESSLDDLATGREKITALRFKFDEQLQRFRTVTAPPLAPKALPPADDWGTIEAIDPNDTSDS